MEVGAETDVGRGRSLSGLPTASSTPREVTAVLQRWAKMVRPLDVGCPGRVRRLRATLGHQQPQQVSSRPFSESLEGPTEGTPPHPRLTVNNLVFLQDHP